jgi:protease-4
MLTRNVESTYNRFVGFVSENRKKNFADIDAIGGGRVWSGLRGKEIGLVDELGSLEDAIKFAAQKAKVKDYAVASYPKKKSKFDQIFSNISDEEVSSRVLQNKVGKENYKIIEEFSKMKNKSEVKMEWPYQINYK